MSADAANARALARLRPHLACLAEEINAAFRPVHPARTIGELLRSADILLKRVQDRVEPGQMVKPLFTSCVTVLEPFGTSGSGSPARRLSTSFARKSANGLMSSPTLAFSSA